MGRRGYCRVMSNIGRSEPRPAGVNVSTPRTEIRMQSSSSWTNSSASIGMRATICCNSKTCPRRSSSRSNPPSRQSLLRGMPATRLGPKEIGDFSEAAALEVDHRLPDLVGRAHPEGPTPIGRYADATAVCFGIVALDQ